MATTKTTTPDPAVNDPSLTGGLTNPDDYKTTQETSGADPVSPAVEPEKATILDIPPGEPYPTGSPPKDPHEPRPDPAADPFKE